MQVRTFQIVFLVNYEKWNDECVHKKEELINSVNAIQQMTMDSINSL